MYGQGTGPLQPYNSLAGIYNYYLQIKLRNRLIYRL